MFSGELLLSRAEADVERRQRQLKHDDTPVVAADLREQFIEGLFKLGCRSTPQQIVAADLDDDERVCRKLLSLLDRRLRRRPGLSMADDFGIEDRRQPLRPRIALTGADASAQRVADDVNRFTALPAVNDLIV